MRFQKPGFFLLGSSCCCCCGCCCGVTGWLDGEPCGWLDTTGGGEGFSPSPNIFSIRFRLSFACSQVSGGSGPAINAAWKSSGQAGVAIRLVTLSSFRVTTPGGVLNHLGSLY